MGALPWALFVSHPTQKTDILTQKLSNVPNEPT
jgi:hypothetical protein